MTQPAVRPEYEPGGVHYEAGLLSRIASAPTQVEQYRLAAELEAHRQGARTQARHQHDLDLGGALTARLQPATASEPWQRTTSDTDWLADVQADPAGLGQVTQAMVAQASVWYSRGLHPAVKAYPGEVLAHAESAAGLAAGPYGTAYPVAHRAFMDHVGHLVSRTADQVPPSSTLPAGVDNDDTFDQPMWDDFSGRPKSDGTSPSDTPSLGEGSAPAGDVAQGIEDTVAEVGHDAGPDGLQHSTDYLDGTTTAPTNSSGATSINTISGRRGLAGHAASFLASLRPVVADAPPFPPHHDGPPPHGSHDGPPSGDPSDPSADVPCPQCLGEGALPDGTPCPLCDGSGMCAPDQAQQFEAAQQQAPPAQAPPGPPPAMPATGARQAHRRVADSVPVLPSDRGDWAGSLDEGTTPEGDHPATGEDLVTPVSHDAGPGNGESTDYLDESSYAWPGAVATRRQASPTLAGPLPGAPAPTLMSAPPMADPAQPDPMAAASEPSWEEQYVASLDPTRLSVLRQAVMETGGGDTPLAAALHDAIARSQNASPAGGPVVPDAMAGADPGRLAAFRRNVASRITDDEPENDAEDGLQATAAQIRAIAGL